MKTFLFLQVVFICLVSIFSEKSFSQTERFFTGSDKIKTNKIKSVIAWGTSYNYGIPREDSSKISIIRFDTMGNIPEIINYYLTNVEDSVWEYSTRQFKYDTLGRQIEMVIFDSEYFPGYSIEKRIFTDSGLTLFSYSYSRWGDTSEKQLAMYDMKKNLVREEQYNSDGEIISEGSYVYEFDSSEKLISIINLTDSTNEICFYYDSCGSRIEQTEYWHDTIFSQYLWKYDSLFFLKEEKKEINYYNVIEKIIFHWDSIGNKIREDFCDLKISDTCYLRKTFVYDSLRKLIEETVYDTGNVILKKTKWVYDSCYVLIKNKFYAPKEIGDGELEIHYRYDGNILEEIKTNAEKKLQYKIVYQYNDYGLPELIIHSDKNNNRLGHIRYVYEYY